MDGCIAEAKAIVKKNETDGLDCRQSAHKRLDPLFAKVPRELIDDQRFDAATLVVAALGPYLHVGDWKINGEWFASKAMCSEVAYLKAMRQLSAAGYYALKRARTGGRFVAIHTWNLPAFTGGTITVPGRRWIEKTRLKAKCRGLLIWMMAHPGSFTREICDRFGIGADTAQGWLAELLEAGLVERRKRRNARGGVDTAYWPTAEALRTTDDRENRGVVADGREIDHRENDGAVNDRQEKCAIYSSYPPTHESPPHTPFAEAAERGGAASPLIVQKFARAVLKRLAKAIPRDETTLTQNAAELAHLHQIVTSYIERFGQSPADVVKLVSTELNTRNREGWLDQLSSWSQFMSPEDLAKSES